MGLANDSAIPPTSPPDDPNQALTDVVLDWEPIKGAKSYQLQISTDQLFPANTIVDQPGHRLRHPLLAAQDSQQRPVLLADPGHRRGRFPARLVRRPVWHFKRTWPDQPTLLYPQHNATTSRPVLLPVDARSSTPASTPCGCTPSRRVRDLLGTCTTMHTTLVYGNAGSATAGRPGPAPTAGESPPPTSTPATSRSPTRSPPRSARSPTHRTWSPPPAPAQRHPLRRPVRPRPEPRRAALTWDPVAGAEKYR